MFTNASDIVKFMQDATLRNALTTLINETTNDSLSEIRTGILKGLQTTNQQLTTLQEDCKQKDGQCEKKLNSIWASLNELTLNLSQASSRLKELEKKDSPTSQNVEQLKKQLDQLAGEIKKGNQRLSLLERPDAAATQMLLELKDNLARMAAEMKDAGKNHRESIANLHAEERAAIDDSLRALEDQKRQLTANREAVERREKAVSTKEAELSAGYFTEMKSVLNTLRQQEADCETAVTQLVEQRAQHVSNLTQKVLEVETNMLSEIESKARELEEKRLEEAKQVVDKKLEEAERERRGALTDKRMLARKKEELELLEASLHDSIELQAKEKVTRLEAELRSQRIQNEHLSSLQGKVDELHHTLASLASFTNGELTPEQLNNKLINLENERAQLLRDISERPTMAEVTELRKIRQEYEILVAKTGSKQQATLESEKLLAKNENARLANEVAELNLQLESTRTSREAISEECDRLAALLKRYQEDESARQESYEKSRERLEDNTQFPIHRREDERPDLRTAVGKSELDWLGHINYWMEESGFVFSLRLLKAFHTSLKVGEWSPLMVLAGVSGTGKSELPRLYAEYGGLNCMLVSVQPNWDSQDALLGFYNSLDNRFEAQPLLRYLISTNKGEEEGGLANCMNLVILDEMNLAHVELYFAEFLSKLEQRRGCLPSEIPALEITLTCDATYQIPLRRNVLWVGTMNQDETTKALSDKVLDRSNCLYFPRPKTLVSRPGAGRAPAFGSQLTPRDWANWVEANTQHLDRHDEGGRLTTRYREMVEAINTALGAVGRGIGHRVWQSILYYMVNYPDVLPIIRKDSSLSKAEMDTLRQGLDTAFQDQVVLKIMPKLRGIETRGHSLRNCLNKIRAIIEDNECLRPLASDFDKAMEFGQGQFLWLSADYLNN